jgi:hypothetical protein
MRERRWPWHLARGPLPAHPPAIPLFTEARALPFVPLGDLWAVARSGGQGRSRAVAHSLPSTVTGLAAGWRLTVHRVVILTLLRITLAPHFGCAEAFNRSVSSHAEARPASVDHRECQGVEASRRFNISSQWIREVIARRKRRRHPLARRRRAMMKAATLRGSGQRSAIRRAAGGTSADRGWDCPIKGLARWPGRWLWRARFHRARRKATVLVLPASI